MFPKLANVRSLLYEWDGTKDIEVEIAIRPGLPIFQILGLAPTTTKESRDRIRLALEASGFYFPMQTVVVNLRPTHILKKTVYLDLAIAYALLCATSQVSPIWFPSEALFLGNLGLNGQAIGGNELLPLVWLKQRQGISTFVLPAELKEKTLPDGQYFFVSSLKDLETQIKPVCITSGNEETQEPQNQFQKILLTKEQTYVFQGLIYSALGKHHSFVMGSPGSGKTFLHQILKPLLPPLSRKEKEIYSIFSPNFESTEVPRPFRSPHHSASEVGLLGGGSSFQKGEISLAHGGILFLDEALEFKERILESLREPMEEGHLEVVRWKDKIRVPANFTLMMAANPCPCGNYSSESQCHCSLHKIRMYLQKISGAFLDRICIFSTLFSSGDVRCVEISESVIRRKIRNAMQFREDRLQSEMEKGPENISKNFTPSPLSSKLSFRKQKQWKDLSRTIADFDLSPQVKEVHLEEASRYIFGYEWIYSLG